MILMWFLGVPSSDSKGFVLYKDDDKTDEVLSYIIDADGKIVCTVRGIPGLTATSTGQLGQNGKFYPFRSTQKYNRHQDLYSPEPAIPTILNQ